MTLPHLIGILTPELVCFHEAGHVCTAASIGATVERVALDIGPPPYGRSSIDREPRAAPFIACGGFAAEHFLYTEGRLVDQTGLPVDDSLFLSEALQNAKQDIFGFAKALAVMSSQVDDPQGAFIGTALSKVLPQIDFRILEKVAAALLDEKVLEKQRLAELLSSYNSNFGKRYRLERMIGFGRVKSFFRARSA